MPPDAPRWQVPRLRRDGRLFGGVAGGIADEVGVDPVWIRVAFVLLAAMGGWGAVLYAGAWIALSALEERRAPAPYRPEPKGANPTNRLIGVGLVTVGLAGLVRALGLDFAAAVTWPVGLLGMGVLLAWHRGHIDLSRATTRAPVARVLAGLGLAGAGIVGFALFNLRFAVAAPLLLVSLALVAGIGLVVAPWASQVVGDLGEERRRRIRSEERARMAAHLHDSVLQTLALIQRSSADPARMTSLARRQERELRAWLYGDPTPEAQRRFRAELERVSVDVEELCGVPVEVVVVGDADVDTAVAELLAAAREAMLNAGKHSGAPRVDVFAEVRPDQVEVFVRDTGKGFEPELVPADRVGLASSVVARLRRVGGKAVIDTAPGQGTEVELRLPRVAP